MVEVEIKPEEIVSKLQQSHSREIEISDLAWLKQLAQNSNKVQTLEDQENSSIIKMRERWGNSILALIGLIIGFDIVLVWMYGVGAWAFTDSKVVIVVITENFLKIFGLGFLITKETFDKIFKNPNVHD